MPLAVCSDHEDLKKVFIGWVETRYRINTEPKYGAYLWRIRVSRLNTKILKNWYLSRALDTISAQRVLHCYHYYYYHKRSNDRQESTQWLRDVYLWYSNLRQSWREDHYIRPNTHSRAEIMAEYNLNI